MEANPETPTLRDLNLWTSRMSKPAAAHSLTSPIQTKLQPSSPDNATVYEYIRPLLGSVDLPTQPPPRCGWLPRKAPGWLFLRVSRLILPSSPRVMRSGKTSI